MHYLAACLLFKDAASYLDEWLRFHLRVGVDHFYLYDNDSMDDYESVVRPFVNAGRVTLYTSAGSGTTTAGLPTLPPRTSQRRAMANYPR